MLIYSWDYKPSSLELPPFFERDSTNKKDGGGRRMMTTYVYIYIYVIVVAFFFGMRSPPLPHLRNILGEFKQGKEADTQEVYRQLHFSMYLDTNNDLKPVNGCPMCLACRCPRRAKYLATQYEAPCDIRPWV